MLAQYYNKETQTLTLPWDFDKELCNLPNSITHLTFEYYSKFNQSVDNLPNSITHLTFGYWFVQPVNNLPINRGN